MLRLLSRAVMANIRVGAAKARDAAPWIEWMARVGFVAKGILYGTIGLFAAMAAMRMGGGVTDTRGAMAALVEAPLGRVLLLAMAIGLLGYAAWRVIEGVADPEQRGSDVKGIAVRSSFVVRGLAHAALGVSALMFAMGRRAGGAGNSEQGREATRTAFELPGGELLLYSAAAGIAAYGLYQLYRAVVAKLSKQLKVGEMRGEAGPWVVWVSRLGIAARGIVFMAVGWTVFRAAQEHDPSEAGGIRQAFTVIEDWGRWPFAAVALGLIAYGVYNLLNARYRRISAG